VPTGGDSIECVKTGPLFAHKRVPPVGK
jgi:hypothetical protein